MRQINLRILTAILTFVIGVVVVAFWLTVYRSPFHEFKGSMPTASRQDIKELDVLSKEYAVYSAILSDPRFINEQYKVAVISSQTKFYHHDDVILRNMPELKQETVNDIQEKNRESAQLSYQFNLRIPYKLLSEQESNEYFLNDNWHEYYANNPAASSLIGLSRVGFNYDGTQALVYVCSFYHGEFVLLEKKDGLWKIKDRNDVWVV